MDSMRQQIRREVAAIRPLDALERQQIAATLAWIDSGAQLCRVHKPAVPARHLVSYFVVVDHTHVLLVDHKLAGLWLPTGGHVEPGEHPRDTVVRELTEELGLASATPIAAPLMLTSATTVGATAGHTDVSLWYVVNADRTQSLRFDAAEFNTVRWFDFATLPFGRSDPHLERFVRKLQA